MSEIKPENLHGRKKIFINVLPTDFDNSVESEIFYIKENIIKCLSVFNQNVLEIEFLNEYNVGKQTILLKNRADASVIINNKVVQNYARQIVEFKKGFYVGKPIKYSRCNNKENDDDMGFINKSIKDVSKASKDMDLYQDLFVSGVGYTFIAPRTDNYDINSEAPYVYQVVDNKICFVVNSSNVEETPLFAGIEMFTDNKIKKYAIYTKTSYYELTLGEGINIVRKGLLNITCGLKKLPIEEFRANRDAYSILEMVIPTNNALNSITSDQLDSLEQFVNSYLVFENQIVDPKFVQTVKDFKKERVIALSTNDPSKPAKVSFLENELNYDGVNNIFERIRNDMFDMAGVPLASSSTTSGGDTGEARLLGNGWENAQNMANVDTQYFKKFEFNNLKRIIDIYKTRANSPVDKINATDIDIKYSYNLSSNLLNKMQSIKYGYDMGMPLLDLLEAVSLTCDNYELAKSWRENLDKIKSENVDVDVKTKQLV